MDSVAFIGTARDYFVQENNACTLIENTTDCIIIEEEKSIKIEAIRSIQEQIKYGPSQHPTLFVIIKKANMLTKEASNAFLKTLESPPHNVCFILLTSSVHALLPTIKSRCQHLYCHYQQKNDVPSTLQSLTSIQNQSIIERLKTAEELSKDKPLAKQHLYHWLEESILSSQYKTQRNIFKKISQLEYNVNTRLQLENLLCYL